MHPVHEVIRLIEKALSDEITSITHTPAEGRTPALRRFRIAGNDQYICEVRGHEPEVISVARRLMKGNLNLGMVREKADVLVVEMLDKVDFLANKAYGPHRGNATTIEFDKDIEQLFTKVIEVHKIDPLTPDEGLVNRASLADLSAYKELDAKGYFYKAGTITVSDQFDAVANLRLAHTQVGADGLWTSAKTANLEPGVDKDLAWSLASAVLKIDGKGYQGDGVSFQEVDGFKGEPTVTRERLKQPRKETWLGFDLG